jgi:predicted O-methyltransferase YrrM
MTSRSSDELDRGDWVRRRVRQLVDRSIDRLRAKLEEKAARNYSSSPLCDAPLAPPAEYRRLWAEAQRQPYPVVDRYEETCGAAIEPAWFHQLALLTQVPIKQSEICYQHGRLLYSTLVQYTRRRVRHHLTVVETGTARGFSALCLAKALEDAGATGKIVSFDVLPHDVKILWNCIRDADGARTRADLLQDYAELMERYLIFHRGDTKREMAKVIFPRINFAFLDSVHQYDHVMAEFSSIRGRQTTSDIIFFDDYTPDAYPGVVEAADEICRNHGYSKNVVTANAQRRYLIAEKQ